MRWTDLECVAAASRMGSVLHVLCAARIRGTGTGGQAQCAAIQGQQRASATHRSTGLRCPDFNPPDCRSTATGPRRRTRPAQTDRADDPGRQIFGGAVAPRQRRSAPGPTPRSTRSPMQRAWCAAARIMRRAAITPKAAAGSHPEMAPPTTECLFPRACAWNEAGSFRPARAVRSPDAHPFQSSSTAPMPMPRISTGRSLMRRCIIAALAAISASEILASPSASCI